MKRIEDDVPLRMIELPQVQALELRLLLYSDDQHRVEHMIEQLSLQLFGITPRDVEFEVPDEYWEYYENSPERRRIDEAYNEYEDQFATGDHLTDDETMQELALLGLDFSNERGQPLRCTKLLGRPAEAAAKGIKGKLPDLESAKLEKFEDALTLDRDAFLAKKRKASSK